MKIVAAILISPKFCHTIITSAGKLVENLRIFKMVILPLSASAVADEQEDNLGVLFSSCRRTWREYSDPAWCGHGNRVCTSMASTTRCCMSWTRFYTHPPQRTAKAFIQWPHEEGPHRKPGQDYQPGRKLMNRQLTLDSYMAALLKQEEMVKK